ncbi:zona pellucida sperm-binding protein 3-like [Brachyistius frenatus]|uniref:zona pellucida sperm-binding protein 3-like n=1 Tax=Brachyistius frenatus TaxID=100188 RepID=UPI0037E81A85
MTQIESPSAVNSHNPVWSHGIIQPQLPALKQQHSEVPSVRPRPVVVKCHPGSMEIVVQADVFDMGLQVDGRHLQLGSNSASGGSDCRAVPSGEEEFTIWAQLMDCGTKLSSTEEKIIYSNVLVYSPEYSVYGLLKLEVATISIECHYEKKYSVDGISMHPTWVPLVCRTSVDDQIDFNLILMSDDWQFERGSSTYFLGDPIHFEVSAIIGNHVPLRVYIDHCTATATPDADAKLKYDFIEHHGCLADAYVTNSNSRFLPRVEEHKLRFQLEAFRFYQEPNNQVYITCYVKAVPVTLTVSSQNRACSLIENRWWSVDGNDQACRNCDIYHRVVEPPSTDPSKTAISTKARPIVASQESSVQNRPEHLPATYVHFRPGKYRSQRSKPQQSSAKLMKMGTNYEAAETLQLGPLTVLPYSSFVAKPRDSKKAISSKSKTT